MFDLMLASLTGTPSDVSVLETASLIGTMFSSHVDCLHVAEPLDGVEALGLNHWDITNEQLQFMEKRVTEQAARARTTYEAICGTKEGPLPDESPRRTVSFAFRQISGHLGETIHEARLHDLTIIARDSRNVITEPDRAGKVMLSAGRPVLVPPRKAAKTFGKRIVVAWKDKPESARAIGFATPLLKRAQAVVILAVSEGETDLDKVNAPARELAQALKWHGVVADVKALPFSLKPAGETILDEAYRVDADLLVMGGYGHSRLREFAFGGVTREILSECEIPVFLSH